MNGVVRSALGAVVVGNEHRGVIHQEVVALVVCPRSIPFLQNHTFVCLRDESRKPLAVTLRKTTLLSAKGDNAPNLQARQLLAQ